MAKYTLVCEEGFGAGTDTSEVHVTFETDSLQDIAEKFFWFIRAAGFDYVDNIDVGNAHFDA